MPAARWYPPPVLLAWGAGHLHWQRQQGAGRRIVCTCGVSDQPLLRCGQGQAQLALTAARSGPAPQTAAAAWPALPSAAPCHCCPFAACRVRSRPQCLLPRHLRVLQRMPGRLRLLRHQVRAAGRTARARRRQPAAAPGRPGCLPPQLAWCPHPTPPHPPTPTHHYPNTPTHTGSTSTERTATPCPKRRWWRWRSGRSVTTWAR